MKKMCHNKQFPKTNGKSIAFLKRLSYNENVKRLQGGIMEAKNVKGMSFLDKVTVFVEKKLAPPLVRISQIRYLDSLQNSFMVLMPYLIIGATATLVLNLGGLFAEDTGLNMPQVAEMINGLLEFHKPWLFQLVFVSINLLALVTAITNGYFLGRYYHEKDNRVSAIVSAMVAFVSFLCFIDFMALSENFDWPNYILGSPSMFAGIIISIASVELYRFLLQKNITIKMPSSVPPMVASAFVSLVPVSVVVIIMAIFGQGLGDVDILQTINEMSQVIVVSGSGPVAQFIGFLLDRILWFVGLHGSNIVGSVMNPIWTQTINENIAAFAAGQDIPYMFTNQWIGAYVRISVLPIAIMLIRSKSERFRVLGKLSLAGSIFNIAEPIMYGLPIVLNPIMFIPWVIGFGVNFIIFAILGVLGITPPIVASVVWTMPAPLAAWIGTGFKLIAPVLSILSYVIIYFIFLPFFKIMEKQEIAKEEAIKAEQEQETQLEVE